MNTTPSPIETVHLIITGEYDERQVRAILTDVQRADQISPLFGPDSRVETWKINNLPFNFTGLYLWVVYIDPERMEPWSANLQDVTAKCYLWEPAYNGVADHQVVVWATDGETAKREAGNLIQHLIKTGEWTTDWNAWWFGSEPSEMPGYQIPVGGTWSQYGDKPGVQVVKTTGNYAAPYHLSEAVCPYCGQTVVLRHSEGPNSGFGLETLCPHITAYLWRDGDLHIEFKKPASES